MWVLYEGFVSQNCRQSNITYGNFVSLLVVLSWGFHRFYRKSRIYPSRCRDSYNYVVNVFLVIIPNQKIVVADLKARRVPKAMDKLLNCARRTIIILHCCYFSHAIRALSTVATDSAGLCKFVFLMGVTIRYYFNLRHSRSGNPLWTWVVTGFIFWLL